jgi:transglutaminase-like putative cysteine protease
MKATSPAPTTPLLPHWPGWRHLPREARDTLYLLAVIALTIAPHALHLPPWASALSALMLLWRARLALAGAALPGRWPLLAALAVMLALTLATHHTLLGREAGITLLTMLMALKTLELRARRDAFVVFLLGFFLILTQFLYSQSLLSAALMLMSVWSLLTAVVLAQMPVGHPPLRLAAGVAARTALYGAPLVLLLFVLFPRIGPLWGVPSESIGRTGLSNQMQFGTMAEIANDDSIAMRLRFRGPRPDPEFLYFRGPVLTRFDGRQWLPAEVSTTASTRSPSFIQTEGSRLDYEITLEPLRLRVLPLLESSSVTPGKSLHVDELRITRHGDLQWQAERTVTERLRFESSAYLRYRAGIGESASTLAQALQLPSGLNPRIIQWAHQLRERPDLAQADASVLVAAVLDHLRTQDFSYTLAPGRYGETSPDLVDEFWFDRRLGFCEHYAAAFVVAMRAMGVPSRVVTGFQGADPSEIDGYTVVRNSHAHAWAEYWAAGQGWQRADPTAVVAPDRVQLSRQLRPEPGLVATALGAVNPQLWASLRRGWEGLNNRWNQWVLNYSRGQQFDLMKRLGWTAPDWQALGQLIAAVIVVLALLGMSWARWDARRRDPWERQRSRLIAALRSLGMNAQPHMGPRNLAMQLREQRGARAEALARLLEALERQRYAPGAQYLAPRPWWRDFKREAAELGRASS